MRLETVRLQLSAVRFPRKVFLFPLTIFLRSFRDPAKGKRIRNIAPGGLGKIENPYTVTWFLMLLEPPATFEFVSVSRTKLVVNQIPVS